MAYPRQLFFGVQHPDKIARACVFLSESINSATDACYCRLEGCVEVLVGY